MDYLVTYRGSVNRWECDENDHLNVRHFAFKAFEGVLLALDTWHVPRTTPVAAQHIRYLKEARVADPLTVRCIPLTPMDSGLRVLAEMRHSHTGEMLAGFVLDLEHAGPAGTRAAPPEAAPRGLTSPMPHPDEADAADAAARAGFGLLAGGIVPAAECDSDGRLAPPAYIARISDGMPNFWTWIEDDTTGFVGGAVLEYRLRYLLPLVNGDGYAIYTAVTDIGNKTHTMTHLIVRQSDHRCAAVAQAVNVCLDLETRRATAMPEARRARLAALRVDPAWAGCD